jgi:hypothetical protein
MTKKDIVIGRDKGKTKDKRDAGVWTVKKI